MLQNFIVILYPPVSVHNDEANLTESSGYCIFEAMVKVAFDLSSIMWTLIIIYSTYATVVHGYTLERLEFFYLTVGYLFPLLVALM